MTEADEMTASERTGTIVEPVHNLKNERSGAEGASDKGKHLSAKLLRHIVAGRRSVCDKFYSMYAVLDAFLTFRTHTHTRARSCADTNVAILNRIWG